MESKAFKSQFQHSYTQMVANWLGVPEDKIRLAQADTDEVAIGRGTYASRSMLGVTDVPMPATPERIWRALHEHPRR
jgi:CO/xanthine dehydrogenase Mo-binding subunit